MPESPTGQVKNDAADRLPGQSINRESPLNEKTSCMALRSSLFEDRRSSLLPQRRENLPYARLSYNVSHVIAEWYAEIFASLQLPKNYDIFVSLKIS